MKMIDFIFEWVGKNYELVVMFFGFFKLIDIINAMFRH